jgi:hypothetical protein
MAKKKRDYAKLEARRQEIRERREADERRIREIDAELRALRKSAETSMGMSFWRFMAKHRPDEYKAILAAGDFDRYITAKSLRAFFGLKPLGEGKGPVATGGGQGKRVYLAVTYGEREEAKAVAREIVGEGVDFRKLLGFDREAKKWFLQGECIDVEPFRKWLPDPDGGDGDGG